MPIRRNYRGSYPASQAIVLFFVLTLSVLAIFSQAAKVVRADEYDEVTKDLNSAIKKHDEYSAKLAQYKKDLSATQAELAQLQADIDGVRASLVNINKNLEIRRVELKNKFELRDSIVRAQYQSGRLTDLEFFLYAVSQVNGFRLSTLTYIFDKSLADEALKIIDRLNTEISNFEKDKAAAEKLEADLEVDQKSLVALKAELDAKRAQAETEVASLEQKIADLSAKQAQILAEKAGEGTVSGYEAPEYKLPDPPSGYHPAFVAMSYGAYTHYNGMSQYGAKGRADSGQKYKDILKHYYKVSVKKQSGFPKKIKVEGQGEMDFQKYLYGLAEMPSSWNKEALKAQAVAARTYAYGFAKSGKTICTTESCQVFSKSKSDDPPGSWKSAVDDTKDEILDNPSTSQYSSTTGGYLNQSGWDTKDGDSGDWPGDAYEKKAKSPWFYKAWYTKGYTDGSDKCGRSTPWLNEEDMADILNAWRVWSKGSSSERSHITPVTTNCWGGDPYSHDEMKDKASKYSGGYDEVSDVSVSQGNNGQTQTVRFKTNKGDVSIDGDGFKRVFNLRAPGYVSLRSRLFDIEMKN